MLSQIKTIQKREANMSHGANSLGRFGRQPNGFHGEAIL